MAAAAGPAGIHKLPLALCAAATAIRAISYPIQRIAPSYLAVFFGPPQELIKDEQVHA